MNGPHQTPDRAEAMGRRLVRTAHRLGMGESDVRLLLDAYRVAMEPRRTAITEDHHPDYLHPARTALILMDDAGVRDATVLAAAVFLETRSHGLAVPADAIRAVDAEVAEAVAAIPQPADAGDGLTESLLLLPSDLIAVASAERLDHARHLHLRDRSRWGAYHRLTCEVYAPVAARGEPRIAERLTWWCDTFTRRFLGGTGQ